MDIFCCFLFAFFWEDVLSISSARWMSVGAILWIVRWALCVSLVCSLDGLCWCWHEYLIMAFMRALLLLMCCIVSWLGRMRGVGGGLVMLLVCCVIMRCLSVLTGSRELFWVSSHMVNICSIPCRRLVYA